jgi:ubiquinone/menaquinone biosynthesis C-methylase UbiE
MTQMNARFSGSIPEIYHNHLGPLLFEPYAVDLAARLEAPVGSKGRILELAAGTGIRTRHLRARVPPSAGIVATDLNEPMLEVARAWVGAASGVEWRQADATALPFPPEAFGDVICQFGLMFFPDKLRAAQEAFRVLRPGGQFLFSVWDSLEENPLGRVAHETVASFFPSGPPEFYLVPFGFHDPPTIRDLLGRAGFGEVAVGSVRLEAVAPSAEHAAIGLVRGSPVLNAIEERGAVDPDTIVAAVAAVLAKVYGDRPLRVPMRAHVVAARRPGRQTAHAPGDPRS